MIYCRKNFNASLSFNFKLLQTQQVNQVFFNDIYRNTKYKKNGYQL